MLLLFPVALVTGRKREMVEFTNFQLAVADQLGTDRLNLRQGRMLLRMFEQLPAGDPNRPARRGEELVELYEYLHAEEPDDELDEAPFR
jgi:hypothetical protein